MRAARAVLLATAILGLATATADAAATISMNGSQVTENLVADLAYFYRHSVRHAPSFALASGDTASGISDAERGVVNAGLVARGLTPSDPPDLRLTALAQSGVCLVSNVDNPVPSLSRAQIQAIVAGRATSWSQVSGSSRNDAIVPIVLSGASESVFESVFLEPGTPVVWQPTTLENSPQVREYILQTPGGFGYVDLGLVGGLHVIDYQGVGCTAQTVANGSYPARRPLGIVTRGAPSRPLARFLHWALTSPVARRVIATHYVPLK
jgi:phosphate transport system substrate-binding protein